MKNLIACAAVLFLAGCQTWGPTWSELTGTRYNDLASMTDAPVVVNLVDGVAPNNSPGLPIKVTPGPHKLVLQAVPPHAVIGFINGEETQVDFRPCTRYYINGRFASSTGTDWRPFVDHEETIAGCQSPVPAKTN